VVVEGSGQTGPASPALSGFSIANKEPMKANVKRRELNKVLFFIL
jgi:hypothetical protein